MIKKLFLIIGMSLSTMSAFSMSDGEAALLGIFIGSHVTRQQQPQVIVQSVPQYNVQREVIVISPSQLPYFKSDLHGYCAPYQGVQYAHCMGRARYQQEMNSAYSSGYYGQ